MNTEKIRQSLKKRRVREKRFRYYGLLSVLISVVFLLALLTDITIKGLPAFQQTYIKLDVTIDPQRLGLEPQPDKQELFSANYNHLIYDTLKRMFPDAKTRKEKRDLKNLVSKSAAYELRDAVMKNPDLLGKTVSFWFLAKDDVDVYMKGRIDRNLPENQRRLKDYQLRWIDQLKQEGRLEKRFNTTFFTASDSREPEQAGIRGAFTGSLLTLMVTIALSFPIGVLAALYLEEYAPVNNRWVDFIEININNLAAVPSIVFGLLGLAVFIGFFGVPRSAPLAGGLVLTLMTLPTIIITSRAAIKSVPNAIREGALALGASKTQVTFGQVLPLAMPGILTGTIIGMAQALGETAPLLLIGMVAFVADVPHSILDPSTALPVQIFLWADSPERAFVERTSAAIMILIIFLMAMNGLAVFMRKKFEKKW
jgi:phosphate transport system permease protein